VPPPRWATTMPAPGPGIPATRRPCATSAAPSRGRAALSSAGAGCRGGHRRRGTMPGRSRSPPSGAAGPGSAATAELDGPVLLGVYDGHGAGDWGAGSGLVARAFRSTSRRGCTRPSKASPDAWAREPDGRRGGGCWSAGRPTDVPGSGPPPQSRGSEGGRRPRRAGTRAYQPRGERTGAPHVARPRPQPAGHQRDAGRPPRADAPRARRRRPCAALRIAAALPPPAPSRTRPTSRFGAISSGSAPTGCRPLRAGGDALGDLAWAGRPRGPLRAPWSGVAAERGRAVCDVGRREHLRGAPPTHRLSR
jgi:hypothetical protein